MGMYKTARWYLQKRSKKRFQKDLSKCFYRMLSDVMGLEDLDAIFTDEEIENIRNLRRVLIKLRECCPIIKPGGFTTLHTEMEVLYRTEKDAAKWSEEGGKKED